MTESVWATDPFSVHVAASPAIADRLAATARGQGARVIRFDLTGVHDRDGLDQLLARTFSYPWKTRGLDAAISMISDLEWLGPTTGHLVIVDGLDDAPEITSDMAGILPNIVDRWRTGGQAFVVVLVGSRHRDAALAALAERNAWLTEVGKLPWVHDTRAVTIIDHGSDE